MSEPQTQVRSPVAGRVVALSEVADPVFSAELVGAGVAVVPEPVAGQALSPIAGTVAKLHPHAFVVVGEQGTAVLVHLGIDTVRLAGEGFELLVEEKSVVAAGQAVTRWDPASVAARGLDPVVMLCVMDSVAGSVTSQATGTTVAAGDVLFGWPAAG